MPREFRFFRSINAIAFPKMGLMGDILSLLKEMPLLEVLNLEDNALTGSFSSTFATDHSKMIILNVQDNKFSGAIPEGLGTLPLLTRFDLSDNQFSGKIPVDIGLSKTIGTLDKFTLSFLPRFIDFFDLANNNLTGEIPLSVFNEYIEKLYLGGNELEGQIPTEVGQLVNVVDLVLGGSKMDGILPPQLFTLPKLAVLKLHDSQFSGILVNSEFAMLADTIQELWLRNNKFAGEIPLEAFEAMSRLEELVIDGNELTGSITSGGVLCRRRKCQAGFLNEISVDPSVDCDCCIGGCGGL